MGTTANWFRKKMVFPELLSLDRVSQKPSAVGSAMSWCSGPLDAVEMTTSPPSSSGASVSANKRAVNGSRRTAVREMTGSASSEQSAISLGPNREFIQNRIRHLVNAFSHRAQAARDRIQLPATPSSISSHETVHGTNRVTDAPPLQQNGGIDKRRGKAEIPDMESDSELAPVLALAVKPTRPSCWARIRHSYANWVIDPQGRTYVVWMSLAAFIVLYNAWMIPLRATFPYQTPNNRVYWMIADYFADLIYIIDVLVIQPRIMFLSEGFWMKDFVATRNNYMKKRKFKMDLLSLLPLDLLYFVFGPEMVILRLPRFLKLHTFWDFFNLVDKLIASPHFIRITRTVLYMMYLIHLNACAYYAFSSWEGIGTNNFVYNGKNNAYIKCFYFATKTATSIGKNPKPTQIIEFMFMTVSWLMGVFVFAMLISQIRDIIATATRSQTEYKKLVDETLEYMRRLNLPVDMQRRVQTWFKYTWETQHTLDENYIMDCLPTKMKTDIAINVHFEVLNKVNLFADCDETLLRELVLQLKSVIYLPGDYICKRGDVGKEMYIIQSGKVEVIGRDSDTDKEVVLATLSEGSVFGEISLLGIAGMNRRTADVWSRGYSNLFVLNKADLNAALSHYPEAQSLLNRKAKSIMRRNAALERQKLPDDVNVVIRNPQPAVPNPRLIEAVLQIVPPDSQANKLLRYGSKGRPRSASSHDGRRHRRVRPAQTTGLLPIAGHYGSVDSSLLMTNATVHEQEDTSASELE